jgi:hypoxanthine-DNA glycosylase
VARADATVLILGSMPGAASLRAGEYYAHPRNLFWRILGELVGAAPGLPYRRRLGRLREARIALWDVLESCARPGSMDADIEHGSVVPNDLAGFLARHRRITRVFFNGSTAERYFRRHALPLLAGRRVQCARLPSTSPAHAGLSFAQKLAAWREILAAPAAAVAPAPATAGLRGPARTRPRAHPAVRPPTSRAASASRAPARARRGNAPAAAPGRRSARGAPSSPGSR